MFKLTTKDKIINVAVSLFAKHGYRQTSMKMIAKEVGIKSSSIYNHFESKECILDEILNLYKIQTYRNILSRDKSFLDKKEITNDEIIERYFYYYPEDELEKYLDILKIIMNEHSANEKIRSEMESEIAKAYAHFRSEMQLLVDRKAIKQCDVEMLTALMTSVSWGYMVFSTAGLNFVHEGYPRTNMFEVLRYSLKLAIGENGVNDGEKIETIPEDIQQK